MRKMRETMKKRVAEYLSLCSHCIFDTLFEVVESPGYGLSLKRRKGGCQTIMDSPAEL